MDSSPPSVRSSFLAAYKDPHNTLANNDRFQSALGAVALKTEELHKKLNVVYIGLLGFLLIGMCAVACVVFGVVEIIGKDSVFRNDGLGEVLTVLGTYFSIPYFFVITLFLIVTLDNSVSRFTGRMFRSHSHNFILIVISTLYLFQASITNFYMTRLTNNYALLVVPFDLAILGIIIYYHKVDSRGFVLHNLLFSIKLAVLWGPAYKTLDDVWGPNGILCMLFLSIPMAEIPLMVSYVNNSRDTVANMLTEGAKDQNERDRRLLMEGQRQGISNKPISYSPASPNRDRGDGYIDFQTPTNATSPGNGTPLMQHEPSSDSSRFKGISGRTVQKLQNLLEVEFVDHFASHFSLYLNHVMHTLDLITLFNFAFIAPTTNQTQKEAPLPFRILIAILFCFGFFTNHAILLHLFYNREDIHLANIPLIQPIIKAANRAMKSEGGGANPDADPKKSYQRRLFQYMLVMLAVVDVPLLIARLELWSGQYAPLSIFVAKNIKDIVDVAMLTLRVNENLRENDDVDNTTQRPGPGGLPAIPNREGTA